MPMFVTGKSYGLIENVENLIISETAEQGITANSNYSIVANGYVDSTGKNDRFIFIKGGLNGNINAIGTKTTVINDNDFVSSGLAYLMEAQSGATTLTLPN